MQTTTQPTLRSYTVVENERRLVDVVGECRHLPLAKEVLEEGEDTLVTRSQEAELGEMAKIYDARRQRSGGEGAAIGAPPVEDGVGVVGVA